MSVGFYRSIDKGTDLVANWQGHISKQGVV